MFEAIEKLNTQNIILTASRLNPKEPFEYSVENGFLGVGTYNGGFLGVARSEESDRFLKWWQNVLMRGGAFDKYFQHFSD
jgi:hypothetical protein